MDPSTFSIVAFDPETGDLGVASQSKFLAVGAVVPWARAGVGAVATQSYANTTFGPRGLELLAQGLSPREVLDRLLADDPQAELRQVLIVDVQGRAAAHTGEGCFEYAGHLVDEGFACGGNILAGPEVVEAMARAFRETEAPLPERLVAALAAGQRAGGDRRGQQSACLLVVREGGGYGGFNDRYIDLRVDDHPRPIEQLEALLSLHRLYFERPKPEDLLPLTSDLVREIQILLGRSGDYHGEITGVWDETTREALYTYFLRENLEERWVEGKIDVQALAYLRRQWGT